MIRVDDFGQPVRSKPKKTSLNERIAEAKGKRQAYQDAIQIMYIYNVDKRCIEFIEKNHIDRCDKEINRLMARK